MKPKKMSGDEEDQCSEVLYEDEVLLIVQWQPGILQKFMERLKPPIETPPPKRVSELLVFSIYQQIVRILIFN